MPSNLPDPKSIIEARSILGKTIRTTAAYFDRIRTVKHPELDESLDAILSNFANPEEVRHGEQDIYLYYRRINHHWLVAVARHLNGDGFLVTAYKTTKKKRRGTSVWPKRK